MHLVIIRSLHVRARIVQRQRARRLRRIQFFALACFVCAGVFMVEDCYHLLKPWFAQSISGYANYVNIFHNNWVVALLIGALLEMYTTHRIGHELRKEEQENHQ